MLPHEFLHQNVPHLPHTARPFLDTVLFGENGRSLSSDLELLYEQARAGVYAPPVIPVLQATASDAAVEEVFSVLRVAEERLIARAERKRARPRIPWAQYGGRGFLLSVALATPVIVGLLLWLTDLPTLLTSLVCSAAALVVVGARILDRHFGLALGHRFHAASRFAFTTAVIFGMLFVGMNYDAYWERAQYFFHTGSTSASTPQQAILEEMLVEPPAAPAPEAPETTPRTGPQEVDLRANLAARSEAIAFDRFQVAPPDDRLVIPKLGKNVPIVHTDEGALIAQKWDELEQTIQRDLERGVVHYPGTANPGEKGNVFITGHSSYYAWSPGNYKSVFALLDQLVVGDHIIVYHKGEKYVYVATTVEVVPPSRTDVLSQPTEASILTLMTCTPVGTAKDRLIIRFDQVSPDPAFNVEPSVNSGSRIVTQLQA